MSPSRIYLDNAATTAPDPRVVAEMLPYLHSLWGNPSSLHTVGREARVALERARKTIAACLGAAPAEIFFTSGGTEADNTALRGAVASLGVRHIITSAIEHHAVLHTAEALAKQGLAQLHLAPLDAQGFLDYEGLETMLHELEGPALVSLMHGNNEVGNLIDLNRVGHMVRARGGYFHTDTVQTLGHYMYELHKMPVDFIAGAAHKFHGPKGAGFMYMSSRARVQPYQTGGAQERNMRGGTENMPAIVGMAKALELAQSTLVADRAHILELKKLLMQQVQARIPGISYNGGSADLNRSLYHVLSVSLPPDPAQEMLLLRLDMEGLCVSGGSACSSGTAVGSHVLEALYPGSERQGVRFSFSRHTTTEEVLRAAEILARVAVPVLV